MLLLVESAFTWHCAMTERVGVTPGVSRVHGLLLYRFMSTTHLFICLLSLGIEAYTLIKRDCQRAVKGTFGFVRVGLVRALSVGLTD